MLPRLKIFKNTTVLGLAVATLVGAFVVYASTVDKTVYETQQLIIIPDKVSSDSWLGLNSVLSQDISEFSLYQDFSETNSAYISELGLYSKYGSGESATGTNEVETNPEPQGGGNGEASTTTDTPRVEPASGSNSEGDSSGVDSPVEKVEPAVDTAPKEELNQDSGTKVEDTAPAEPSQASPSEPVSVNTNNPVWGVFAKSSEKYKLAQGIIDEPTTPEVNNETTDSSENPQPEAKMPASTDQSVENTPEAKPEPETNNPKTPDTEASDTESSLGTTSASTDASDISGSSSVSATETTDINENEQLTEVNTSESKAIDECKKEDSCETHSMYFTGFTLPDFESGSVLDSAQLRLSLAAQTKKSHGSGLQRFLVEYTYDTGSTTKNWNTASKIDINDEISNSINGGYFLVSIDTPPEAGQIANLTVRVSYQGKIADLDKAYVEGVWLDVTSGRFYESEDAQPFLDTLDYERSLEKPKLNDLVSADIDQSMGRLPSFVLDYASQQNFIKRIYNNLFGETKFTVSKVLLSSALYGDVVVPFKIDYHDDLTWSLTMQEQPQKLQPGKYKITVLIDEDNKQYTDSFEFYWGMLAVNTMKSMYFPNEVVKLDLAALNEDGETLCDADLKLQIIDPDNTISDVPIEKSGTCTHNNITDVPDYQAVFNNTFKSGLYKLELTNLNKEGKIVHKIRDSFEVREYIPYDIERTAPTRIYPPEPYTVNIKIKANRTFEGDIVEKVPRGFVISSGSGAEISTMPEFTTLTWKGVNMSLGDVKELSYKFDAPDISPYLYLLGPLNMDGFEELRQWQIASDALTNVAWLTGTRSVNSTNINAAASPMQFATSSYDNYYFSHSTTTNSQTLNIRQPGDYFIAVNVPQERTDANGTQSRVGIEVRVNGVAVPQGLGRSSLIQNAGAQNESSAHANFMLTGLQAGDNVEAFVQGLNTITGLDIVNINSAASMYVEYISPNTPVFAATTTRTTNDINFNQVTPYALSWAETRQGNGFVHSDTVSPQNITISNPGTYFVQFSLPLYTISAANTNVLGRVLLNGVQVPGGTFSQGYVAGAATANDRNSSIHWSGVVTSTSSNQILTISTEAEATAGSTTVPTGFVGSIFVRQIPNTETIVLRSRGLFTGTNYNVTPAVPLAWTTQVAYDATTFSHSTTTNNSQITVNADGDYLLTYSDAYSGATARTNTRVRVMVGTATSTGAETKSHYLRNGGNQNNSSGAFTYLITGITSGQIVRVYTELEATAGTVSTTTDAILTLTKKANLNMRPTAPTPAAPFDNARLASTTPYFDFITDDPDGSSRIEYEFSIATSSDFSNATNYTSSSSAGWLNTVIATDTSPFIESQNIRFQLPASSTLSDLTTYYWRVRGADVTGSGNFGDWSTTQSISVDLAVSVPNWYQTFGGQFAGNTLVGTVSSGNNNVQVDSTPSAEIMLAYGEGTVNTPRYRLWDGSVWGIEQSALAVGGTVNWVRTAAGNTRDEYVMVTVDQGANTYAQVYSASSSSWGNSKLLTGGLADIAKRGIAVGYESLSGDAVAVSCSSSTKPVFSIWNGSTWSATSTINTSSLNNCGFLDIASDPASDEMILIYRDTTGSQYEAVVWDGSTWGNNKIIGSSNTNPTREAMTVGYESSGNQALVIVANNTNNNIIYTTWDGSGWSSNATQALANDFTTGRVTSDPASDKMILCYIDANSNVGVLRWDGGVWSTNLALKTGANSTVGRPTDCQFETVAGRTGNIINAYSNTVNSYYRVYATSTWAIEALLSTVSDSFWINSERAGDGTIVEVNLDDATDIIETSYWNGTTWSTKSSLETSPSSVIAVPYEMFDMSAKRYQFTSGVVTSKPINFSSVPSQPTWGDISFSTTEPFGTDVRVKLKFTSTTTCDSYVPNGALPGNGAGFDVSSSSISLVGISTTTYSQICLEASLTTLGGASASLNDWSLSWVRDPKLIQNAYRFYVNGSFLTPTDVWPLGVLDLPENSPLTATEAINSSSTIRLRMSLQGVNITMPTSTKAFKLQYSPGEQCSTNDSWFDVGATSSTTALWRGYANSIAGLDWYSAAWTRRTKITIDKNLVPTSVTDFPVYVDLGNLSASFFANVKSDGADIRVTKGDGMTEVPFELVSINTTAKSGELHFKADLSSTTSTPFYIYYGNSGASAYLANATYGSQNVWTNSYLAVYHLQTSPASNLTDSTSFGRTLTTNGGMTATSSVGGVLGQGIYFDGINDRLTNAGFSWTATPITVTTWNNVTTAQVQNSNLFGFTANGNERFATHAPWSDNVIYWDYGTCCSAPGRLSTNYTSYRNKWTHIGLVSQGTSGSFMGIYLDGNAIATSSASDNPNVTLTGFALGSTDPSGGSYHRGQIDEFRIASVARSANWIKTEQANQSNPIGFGSVSTEELIGDGATLPSTLLSTSDYKESYEESNPTNVNANAIIVGNDAEWDFSLQNNNASANTNYCFRMVYQDGSNLSSYVNYPKLITNAPPQLPALSAPFDNEKTASTSPWFDFAAEDDLGDLISYEVQIDDNADFSSPTLTRDSNSNFALFTNLSNISQRSQYTSGATIRYIPNVTLTNNTTYYWRVRGKDDAGSNTYGNWSNAFSFTVDTGTTITTWYQTTGDQFSTNSFQDAISSTSTNDIGIDGSFTVATATGNAIDYDDRNTGNAWGSFSFNNNITTGSIKYYVEYQVSGVNYELIPDTDLPGNTNGFTSSPVVLTNLDTVTYNNIRLVAVLSGNSTLPKLLDWTVTWANTIAAPSLTSPFDNAKVSTTTPTFTFTTADPELDDLEYEVQLSSSYNFTSSSTFTSGVSAGFSNVTTPVDISPFNSGNTIRYSAQSALSNNNTYWWRARARDPLGGNSWSRYSSPKSFTIDTAVVVSTWYQTTGEQFSTDVLQDIETSTGTAKITTTVREMLMAWGEGTGQSPRFMTWDGSVFSATGTAGSVNAQIRWLDVEAAPTRPEYAMGSQGTDFGVNVQIYNSNTEIWGNTKKQSNSNVVNQRGFDIAYETVSGNLLAVSCSGQDAVYSSWNGSSWSATSSLNLTIAANCESIVLASDPLSDEIIAIFKHTNTGGVDYQMLVWNGSSWGNSFVTGNINVNGNLGAAVVYEESGDQAMVVVGNGTNNNFIFTTWNGTAWAASSTIPIFNDFAWASLKRDKGTDKIAVCYIDASARVGVAQWSGTAWASTTELDLAGNSSGGRPIDCEYETIGSRDGYIMAPYSDGGAGGVGAGASYQFYATSSWSGKLDLGTQEDSWRVLSIRALDGIIHTVFFDDVNAYYGYTRWDGVSWTTPTRITNPSIVGTPFDGSLAMAAQIYPNFTNGQIISTPIDFTDGTGPRWERVIFSDTKPGSSLIRYKVLYESSNNVYSIIPDSALSGNSTGFTSSPIDISALDKNIYSKLKLEGDFTCVSGNCPVLNDWSVEWSAGITVSGNAYDYDAITAVTSGNVAVAVNGVLQPGKTGTITASGTWSIANVTAFTGDTVTVFIDGASDVDESVAIGVYDGVGNISGMELSKRNVTIGSNDNGTTTNAGFAQFDSADDEDIFFTSDISNNITLCNTGACFDSIMRIKIGNTYQPGANASTNDFNNFGIFLPATSTFRVGGSWNSPGTFTPAASTIIFTATTSSRTISNATSSIAFNNVTFGETVGSATWTIAKPLFVAGNLAINFGTLSRATTTINVSKNLAIGTLGNMTGVGTTTFDGSGSHTWADTSASTTNIGNVLIDGISKTVTLAGNVQAESLTIGSDDTFNLSGSGFNINVVRGWTNNNAFIPQTGTVTFTGSSTNIINNRNSSFNNLTFSGAGGNWSFSTSSIVISGNLTIATGTVTLPTATTSVGGSFLNTGGMFLHNNGEVRMTSNTVGRSITQSATTFLNAFYNLVFTGSGAWSFTEANATTTNNLLINSGTVTFPSGTLSVGGDLSAINTGAFQHNNGEVILLVQNSNIVRTNGSNFNNLKTLGFGFQSWYNNSWTSRQPIVINSSFVPTTVTDFPVYVNLANLPASFFSTVQASGTDIRVTTGDGLTEVPYELVDLNTVAGTGELHFKAPSVSSTTNTTFYIYYGNAGAQPYSATSTFGRNNVWSNGYEAVYHLGTNPAATMIDSTRNGRNLTQAGGMLSGNSVAGVLGNGVDFDGVNDSLNNATYAWPSASNTITVTAWNNVSTAETKASNLFGFANSAGERVAAHGPWSDGVLYWDFGLAVTPGRVQTSYTSYRDKWTHVGLVSPGAGGGNMIVYLDGGQVVSGTASDPSITLTGFNLGSGNGGFHDGRIDEFRIASVVRTAGWIATERNNQASSTTFYNVPAVQGRTVRTFTDTNAAILGNYILENGGDSVFPTGVLSIGGSFDNNAAFTNSSGTVRFNSSSGAETIKAGTSSFATLDFNSVTGNFTIVSNATSTVAVTITNASAFTVNSGVILTVAGTFQNNVGGSSTTWTGSTLNLTSGTDYAINTKTTGADVYANITATGDTDVTMWNSSSTAYQMLNTASVYSQNHNSVPGSLFIFGNYTRTTGTEFWSFATDFDGTALNASNSRQANVRVASSSFVGLQNSSFNMVGTSSASTTVDAQSGSFTMSATNTTVTAEQFRFTGTDLNGLQLRASSTLSMFRNGLFTVAGSNTGISIDGSTVSTNPTVQYPGIGFATSTIGTSSNVTLTSSSTSFIWFTSGFGGLYGEAFDALDGNPGSIRFDDSSYGITVSGTVFADEGVTALGAPTCNGVTNNVKIVVDGGSYSSSTSCAAGTGAYSFANVSFTGSPKIVVYLDTNGGVNGSVITKTPTANITNMNIYANRVITRHEGGSPMTAGDMTLYNFANDTDIKFLSSSSSLVLIPGVGLNVWASTTFTPGVDMTLRGNASSTTFEGTLSLGASSTFNATAFETHTLSGRLVLATSSVLNAASSTFIFNATTTGKSISNVSGTITFNNLQFNGVLGGWNITAPLQVNGNMAVNNGTVTGTNDITIPTGSLLGNGLLSLGGGTTTLSNTNTFGGTQSWTVNNLVLGTGLVGTTTVATNATTTVLGRLTIGAAHNVVLGGAGLDLSGSGTVLVENGNLAEGTSTIRYIGSSSTVAPGNYYNLSLAAGAGSPTYTGSGVGIAVINNLSIGGIATSTFNMTASDPSLSVGGSILINNRGIFSGSDISSTTVVGNWTNTGTYTSNNGVVSMVGSSTSIITAGSSTFATLNINGIGNFTINSNATSTIALNLSNHGSFTQASGTTLALGGALNNGLGSTTTTWTGSTLYFYGGGTKVINTKNTLDSYNIINVAASTNVKMWNSGLTSFVGTGGLYSQNHNNVSGSLNIYGNYLVSSGNDYWDYDTDFDGASIASTSRQVNVALASSSSVIYNGGSLEVSGSSTATTTINNQGAGTYGIMLGSNSSTTWKYVSIRDINISGLVFSGTATVNDFSYTDSLVKINSGSALTVGGTVIDVNQAKNFTNNIFASSSGVSNARNVTATGTSVSSWRYTNHSGNIAGEAFDTDPAGDPGYLVWDNSTALITVSGNVYSDEGVTVSTACDGSNDIVLRVAGLTSYSTTCNPATGAYSIPNVAFGPTDTLTLYIDGKSVKAANVTIDPQSSISNMNLYENRVIVRHEGTNPITIAKMAVWTSANDADIPFSTVIGSPNTLTLPADRKLLIWTGKTFEPNGNVTVSGGGSGAAFDGTLEAQTNARFRAIGTETHSIGGSMIFNTGADYVTGLSTTNFTTSGSARTIDINSLGFYNVNFTGSGSWTVTDSTLTAARSVTQSAGVVTYGNGTTTIGASFNVTGGSFTMNGVSLLLNSTSTGNIVRFNGSSIPAVRFNGTGGAWSMTDTNATTTGSFFVQAGSVTLPSGTLSVGANFENQAGTITHNNNNLFMRATSSATFGASSSPLYSVNFTGSTTYAMLDNSITFADSFTITAGTVNLATGTLAVGANFTVASGTLNASSSTILFNSVTTGKTVRFGNNVPYNVVFGSASGGWTLLGNATTSNNFSITGANSFTKENGTTLAVNGVFTNLVGGAATTWINTTLALINNSNYTLNTKTTGGDDYSTLRLGTNSAIRTWNSSFLTTVLGNNSSIYSQDHGNVDGSLNIYGNFAISTSTEYWAQATDFDGTTLSGPGLRSVTVSMAPNSTTTLSSGALVILGGSAGATTTITNQATGSYAFIVNGGTFSARYYSFANLNSSGLTFTNTPVISEISNGFYNLTAASGTLISVASSSLNANASKVFTAVGFNASGSIPGFNVGLNGSTSNSWRFSGSYGNLNGEAFDIDGATACGSIRFDNSACLLTEQKNARWRNDDGGEGAPNSEWYNTDWSSRKRVRISNSDATAYASTAVKMTVAYDSSMKSNFDDLRFTANNGTTLIPYWIERFTASTEATVWVRVPNLPASALTTVFMYFGNASSSAASSGAATFDVFEDYENNSLASYSGDTSLFTTDTAPVYGGNYALEALNKSGRTTNTLYKNSVTTAQGQIIRWMQYVDTAGSGDEACTLFGVQNPGSTRNNYGVCLEQFGVDRISLTKNVIDNDVSGTNLASSSVTFTTGWYEVEVDWRTNNSINVYLYNNAGSLIATTSATDASYTTGGLGYAFWFQQGSWDSYTARPRAMLRPAVYFGAKQGSGGATWNAAQNSVGNGVPGTVRRLRVAIENSGLDITNQQFRLESAPKGAAPSCEAVTSGSFTAIPNQASCGTSAICIQNSSYVTDDSNTSDLLASTSGQFTIGKQIESPSNRTTSLGILQNYYTELEFAITPTINATDKYCFRVTNNGVLLDSYTVVPELTLQYNPTFGAVNLNGGQPIILTPGATTTIYATGTVTDLNGYADLVRASSTIYRSGVGAACSANNNSCYISTTTNNCSFVNCAGNTCELRCRADIYFHADPTDIGTYSGQDWQAFLEVNDASGGYDFNSAPGVELYTLRALNVDSGINYGALSVGGDTGSINATTTVTNLGNINFDVDIQGTDLSDGASSSIPSTQQKFATSTFNYLACGSCASLSSSTAVRVLVGLPKPTTDVSPVSIPIYWGIQIPVGVRSTLHQGVNVFTPV